MTQIHHKDIYTKFMIEYDKANVTSSYPSLTEYEVATVLDKAYQALIAQKITGNNVRRAPFEADTKSISDIQPLIVTEKVSLQDSDDVKNMSYASLPEKFFYFVEGYMSQVVDGKLMDTEKDETPKRSLPVLLVTHAIAKKFFCSAYNMPWVKIPVCYIENNNLYVVYDSVNTPNTDDIVITFIKTPHLFAKDLTTPEDGYVTYFEGTSEDYYFECNSSMAEELVSLAVSFALENVESPRLNTKLNMRGLEA